MVSSVGRRFANLLLPLVLLLKGAAAEGPAHAPVSLTGFADVKDIPSAVVSPDGATIACIVTQPDLKANRVKSDLWLVPTVEGEPRRLAIEAEGIDRVLWSPRSKELALVGKAARKAPHEEPETWLWIVDAASGKDRRLLRLQRSNHYLAHQGADLCWSPDGASLAYLASAAPPPPSDGPVVVRRIQYKTRTALSDNRRTHLWTVEVSSGKTRQLTDGRFDEHSIDWSPRGEIVFCSNRQDDPDASLNNDLYAVRVTDGTVRRLTHTPGNEMSPVWAPDGRSLVYTITQRAITTIDSVAEDAHVHVLDCDNSRSRDVTEHLDRRCAQVRWAADGKSVLFLAADRGRGLLYRAPAKGGESTPLFTVEGVVSSFSLPQRSPRGACVLSTPTRPAEVWTFNADGSGLARRTRLNANAVAGWKPVEPREVRFQSFDGTPIQGWLLLPPQATPENRAALVLSIHGGPHGMYGYSFSAGLQLLCARGYAVLYLNPRGSSGYGQHFSDGCVNDWGGGDYKDLMAGVDHVLARYPQLDGERLGITGGSYGGYMTMWAITQTSRFKAAVPYAGLSNLISFYGTSLYQDLIHVEFRGRPWDHYDLLWQRSPLCHVKRVTTPTLFLHGEADNDVPIGQSEEMYTALKQRGVEAVLVRYPREGHGATEPRYQLDQLERKVAWLERLLRPRGQAARKR